MGADGHRLRPAVGLAGQVHQQRHPGVHPAPSLLEVQSAGVVVHVQGDLVHPGQGVEDHHIRLRPRQLPLGEDVDALVPLVGQGVGETLPLDAGHIQNVQPGQHRFQAGDLPEPQAALLHEAARIVGDGQLTGGDEIELHVVEFGQGFDEGVDGAPVLQVAAQTDGHAVDGTTVALDGGQVGQGLGGVHVTAVPGVDDGHFGVQRCCLGSALLGVAHDDDIGVGGDHFDGILQRFTFGSRRAVGVVKAEHRAAQPQHGGLEGEFRPGGGFKEQVGLDAPLARLGKGRRVVHDLGAALVQIFPLCPGQVAKIDQMPKTHR